MNKSDYDDYYNGRDATCKRCGAKFLRFRGVHDGGICPECFSKQLAAYLESRKQNDAAEVDHA